MYPINEIEFLIAAMNEEKLLSVSKMEQAFKVIDLVSESTKLSF
jgi:hypothetical protein